MNDLPFGSSAGSRDQLTTEPTSIPPFVTAAFSVLQHFQRHSVFLSFTENDNLPPCMDNVLLNTLASRIRPLKHLSRKSFEIIKESYLEDCHLFETRAVFRAPDQFFTFFGQHLDYLAFYIRFGPDDDFREVPDLLLGLGRYCRVVHVSRAEANCCTKLCYSFLCLHPSSSELFVSFLKLGINLFPIQFIADLRRMTDRASFTIVCFAAKVNTQALMEGHQDLIKRSFAFIGDERSRVENSLIATFPKSAFAIGNAACVFGHHLTAVFCDLLQANASRVWDRLFIVAEGGAQFLDHHQ
jgi:hypothetical protein